jgi:acetyl-CoA C-acetyltransferase
MRSVSIVGIGQTPVGRWADRSLCDLAVASLSAALHDAGMPTVQALYVSSLLAHASQQEDLPAAVARAAALSPSESVMVAAHCGGGVALHMGVQAVASGLFDVVAVTGVDKVTGPLAAEAPDEAAQGLTAAGLHALIMRRYMYEYSWRRDDFAPFALNAHRNGAGNGNAMLRHTLTIEQYRQAPAIADPLCELDAAPLGDGSATVILCPTDLAQAAAHRPARITASDVARDTAALHDRADILWLKGAHDSARAAYGQAGRTAQDIDLFEPHDAFTIVAALSLEAAGFAEQGAAVRLAQSGAIGQQGQIPMCTMGGLKARGNPGAASGVYQAVEIVLQLRGAAGSNQVDGARVGMAQSMGGNGACVATHILEM